MKPSSAPVLVLDQARFGYAGSSAVRGVQLRLMPGEAVALLGPNGSGKSTLIKGLLGLNQHLGGTVELGEGIRSRPGAIGSLPQHQSLDPDFPVTLRQVVMMGRYRRLPWWRWPGRADRARVRAALETVGLLELADARFGTLSGGQRQRGLLARALAADPLLLLLDEPFNGLDQANRDALLATLTGLRDAGMAIILSTHDLELAQEVCQRALVLDAGDQLACLSVPELLASGILERFRSQRPRDPQLARMVPAELDLGGHEDDQPAAPSTETQSTAAPSAGMPSVDVPSTAAQNADAP